MITDKLNMFSEAQATVRAANTYASARSIDLGLAVGTKGIMLPMFYAKTGDAFTGGTSVEFQLVCADDADLTVNPTVLATSGAIADASLTANKIVWSGQMPRTIPRRYLGMRYVGVGVHSAGTITAGLADHVPLR